MVSVYFVFAPTWHYTTLSKITLSSSFAIWSDEEWRFICNILFLLLCVDMYLFPLLNSLLLYTHIACPSPLSFLFLKGAIFLTLHIFQIFLSNIFLLLSFCLSIYIYHFILPFLFSIYL